MRAARRSIAIQTYFCEPGAVTTRLKALLTTNLVPGLGLGILLGALVIVAPWVLIWIYVRWANRHYDAVVAGLRHGA